MRAAIYTRVSTKKNQSCDRQVADLTEFALNRGDEVITVVSEHESGAKNDRAERKKLLQLARQRKIDVILVTEMSRWGRSTLDLISTCQELADHKVSLVAYSGGLNFDLSTAQGKLVHSLLAAMSEFERDLIRERVCSGLANARAKGKQLGRRIGRKSGDDHQERTIQRQEIIDALQAGDGIRSTALRLGVSKTTVLKISKELRQ